MMKKFLILFIICGAFITAADDFKYPFDPLIDRDPLSPLINERGDIIVREKIPNVEIENIILQGIIYSQEGSIAIINNEMFYEGSNMGDYKIKKITSNGVFLDKSGEEYFIKWEAE